MEGFLIRGWDYILSGCGGTSTLSRGLDVRWFHEPQSATSQCGWVPTTCGAVSTRGISVFAPRFLELFRY